jgi:hypothetical protein
LSPQYIAGKVLPLNAFRALAGGQQAAGASFQDVSAVAAWRSSAPLRGETLRVVSQRSLRPITQLISIGVEFDG